MESWGSDANGNTIAEQEKAYTDGRESSNMSISGRIGGSSLKVYKYDAFNRLIQYNDSVSEATYTYGADNLRASKTVNGAETDFVWNGQNLAGEFRRDTVNTYTYDITGIHMANQNGTVASYIKDYHGNIVAKADTSGNMIDAMIDRRDYDAFGNHRNGAEADPFGYCGEYYDNESGLIYLRNRYYNSAIGRFITEDPVKDGLNWYSYAGNNPVMFVDPLGLSDVPRYLDWDDDGRIDTKEDRLRFDKNGDGRADWLDNGISKEWYQLRDFNVLEDFPYEYQEDYELCWAADASMVVEWFTGEKIDFIRIAKDHNGEDFEHGSNVIAIGRHIRDSGYLEGSGYEVDNHIFNYGDINSSTGNSDNNPLTFEKVQKQIDAGIPMIMRTEERHVEVLIGYGYDKELGKQMLLFMNSNDYMDAYDFNDVKRGMALTFKKVQ